MDIFSTAVLANVVAALPPPEPFILNSFFRNVQTETSEEIHFDVDSGRRRIAPFVAPIVAGKVVTSKGFITKTFKPAYVKDKRVFTANRALKRAMGEQIGGSMNPAQRMQALLAQDLQDQIQMLTDRQELMAVEALVRGGTTVMGDEYPEVFVDFGRHADHAGVLAGGDRWGETGVEPLDDLQGWSLTVSKNSGATANILLMDIEAWKLFSASEKVQKLLDRYRGSDQLNPTVVGQGGRYMGNIGDYDIHVYGGWYEDPVSKDLKPFLPENSVIMLSADLDGTRAYGAIQDEEAGLQALPFFSKSWLEKDPGVRYLLLQSAPLPVPYRVNASLYRKVR